MSTTTTTPEATTAKRSVVTAAILKRDNVITPDDLHAFLTDNDIPEDAAERTHLQARQIILGLLPHATADASIQDYIDAYRKERPLSSVQSFDRTDAGDDDDSMFREEGYAVSEAGGDADHFNALLHSQAKQYSAVGFNREAYADLISAFWVKENSPEAKKHGLHRSNCWFHVSMGKGSEKVVQLWYSPLQGKVLEGGNRQTKLDSLPSLVAAVTNGQFLCADPISFGDNGDVINGGHRSACILMHADDTTLFSIRIDVGIPAELFSLYDKNRVKGADDDVLRYTAGMLTDDDLRGLGFHELESFPATRKLLHEDLAKIIYYLAVRRDGKKIGGSHKDIKEASVVSLVNRLGPVVLQALGKAYENARVVRRDPKTDMLRKANIGDSSWRTVTRGQIVHAVTAYMLLTDWGQTADPYAEWIITHSLRSSDTDMIGKLGHSVWMQQGKMAVTVPVLDEDKNPTYEQVPVMEDGKQVVDDDGTPLMENGPAITKQVEQMVSGGWYLTGKRLYDDANARVNMLINVVDGLRAFDKLPADITTEDGKLIPADPIFTADFLGKVETKHRVNWRHYERPVQRAENNPTANGKDRWILKPFSVGNHCDPAIETEDDNEDS